MLRCPGFSQPECYTCLDAFSRGMEIPTGNFTAVITRSDAKLRHGRMRLQLHNWLSPVIWCSLDYEHPRMTQCYDYCVERDFCRLAQVNFAEASAFAVYITNVALALAAMRAETRQMTVFEDDCVFSNHIMKSQLRMSYRESARLSCMYTGMGCGSFRKTVSTTALGMTPCSRAYTVTSEGIRRIAHGMPVRRPIDIALPNIFANTSSVCHLSSTPIRHGSYERRLKRGQDF